VNHELGTIKRLIAIARRANRWRHWEDTKTVSFSKGMPFRLYVALELGSQSGGYQLGENPWDRIEEGKTASIRAGRIKYKGPMLKQ
jgi:hypothetical protein